MSALLRRKRVSLDTAADGVLPALGPASASSSSSTATGSTMLPGRTHPASLDFADSSASSPRGATPASPVSPVSPPSGRRNSSRGSASASASSSMGPSPTGEAARSTRQAQPLTGVQSPNPGAGPSPSPTPLGGRPSPSKLAAPATPATPSRPSPAAPSGLNHAGTSSIGGPGSLTSQRIVFHEARVLMMQEQRERPPEGEASSTVVKRGMQAVRSALHKSITRKRVAELWSNVAATHEISSAQPEAPIAEEPEEEKKEEEAKEEQEEKLEEEAHNLCDSFTTLSSKLEDLSNKDEAVATLNSAAAVVHKCVSLISQARRGAYQDLKTASDLAKSVEKSTEVTERLMGIMRSCMKDIERALQVARKWDCDDEKDPTPKAKQQEHIWFDAPQHNLEMLGLLQDIKEQMDKAEQIMEEPVEAAQLPAPGPKPERRHSDPSIKPMPPALQPRRRQESSSSEAELDPPPEEAGGPYEEAAEGVLSPRPPAGESPKRAARRPSLLGSWSKRAEDGAEADFEASAGAETSPLSPRTPGGGRRQMNRAKTMGAAMLSSLGVDSDECREEEEEDEEKEEPQQEPEKEEEDVPEVDGEAGAPAQPDASPEPATAAGAEPEAKEKEEEETAVTVEDEEDSSESESEEEESMAPPNQGLAPSLEFLRPEPVSKPAPEDVPERNLEPVSLGCSRPATRERRSHDYRDFLTATPVQLTRRMVADGRTVEDSRRDHNVSGMEDLTSDEKNLLDRLIGQEDSRNSRSSAAARPHTRACLAHLETTPMTQGAPQLGRREGTRHRSCFAQLQRRGSTDGVMPTPRKLPPLDQSMDLPSLLGIERQASSRRGSRGEMAPAPRRSSNRRVSFT